MLSTIRGSNSLTAKKYIRSEKERQCGTELEASVVILNMCQMTLDRRRRGSIEMLGNPPPLHLNEQSEADTKTEKDIFTLVNAKLPIQTPTKLKNKKLMAQRRSP